jgi:tetratricopeptide (TPR) repeat protein
VFERFGLIPGQAPADEAARRVAASAVRDRLVVALDRWLKAERSADVRAVLRAVDPDVYRDAVRDAVLAADSPRLAELAGRPEALGQPPGFAAFLGGHYEAIPVERRRELLREALRQWPGDPGLLITMGYAYWPRWGVPDATTEEQLRQYRKERVRWFQSAVAVQPRSVLAHYWLAKSLATWGDKDEAVTQLKETIRLDPKCHYAWRDLGFVLQQKKDGDGMVAAWRELVRLDPKNSEHRSLFMNALWTIGDRDGAVAFAREGVRLNPTDCVAHLQLGHALKSRGDVDGAIAAYKEASQLAPKDPNPHNFLGRTLEAKGDLDGAIASFKKALRLNSKLASARYLLRLAERCRELLPRLPDIAAGRAEPKAPAEACEFAELCARPFQQRYVLAVRLYEKAFAADRKLADTPDHRYNAACCAALAAAGKGKEEGAPLSPSDRAALRAKALAWLRADLPRHQTLAASAKPAERQQAANMLLHWLSDRDLEGLRQGAPREGWAEDEAAAWDRLWQEVRTTRDAATKLAP